MSNTAKFYKCYKGTCSKCLDEDDPYITENKYKELLDADGKIQCPEGHLECGIQELKPEDLPKAPPDNKKKLILIVGAVLLAILIGAGGYAYYWFTKVKTTVETGIDVVNTVSDLVKDTSVTNAVKGVITDVASAGKEVINDYSKETTPVDNNAGDKSGILTSSSIQDSFNKISDPTISYSDKQKIKSNMLAQFMDNAQVIIQINNNPTQRFDISYYIESLTNTQRKIKIIKTEKNETKISKLFVEESN